MVTSMADEIEKCKTMHFGHNNGMQDYYMDAGVMLNFFSGWPIGPAKIDFG